MGSGKCVLSLSFCCKSESEVLLTVVELETENEKDSRNMNIFGCIKLIATGKVGENNRILLYFQVY